MIGIYTALLFATASAPEASRQAALHVAHQISRDAGYKSNPSAILEYEFTDKPESPAYPGYTTVQIMYRGSDVFDVSINNITGDAFDFNKCIAFAYGRNPSKSEIAIYAKEMALNGCDSFRILKNKGDETRKLIEHKSKN